MSIETNTDNYHKIKGKSIDKIILDEKDYFDILKAIRKKWGWDN